MKLISGVLYHDSIAVPGTNVFDETLHKNSNPDLFGLPIIQ